MKFVLRIIVIMGLMSFVLSFFGCTSATNVKVKPEGEISSISIGQNHMNRNYCYSFSAYKDNDEHYFNAWCLLTVAEDDFRDVELDDVLITKEEFEEFSKLDEKYDFFSYLKQEKKNNRLIEPQDMTTKSFNVSYNGESVSLKTDNRCYEAVYDYFIKLAEKYSD